MEPFETVSMDFIVKLPLSHGYDTILTVTNHDCSKATLFIPCNKTINAEGVAKLYLQHVYHHYGLPKKVIYDQDTHFTSTFTRALCKALDI